MRFQQLPKQVQALIVAERRMAAASALIGAIVVGVFGSFGMLAFALGRFNATAVALIGGFTVVVAGALAFVWRRAKHQVLHPEETALARGFMNDPHFVTAVEPAERTDANAHFRFGVKVTTRTKCVFMPTGSREEALALASEFHQLFADAALPNGRETPA